MLRKKNHHHTKQSPVCGEIVEILSSRDYPRLDVAVVVDIKPTRAHFHTQFDEIYFVVDGSITLGLYDPETKCTHEVELEANELQLIASGIHHKVISSSIKNRLVVLSVPGFDPNDEHKSDEF